MVACTNLERAYEAKVAKYGNIRDLGPMVSARYRLHTLRFSAITLSYRGVWCKSSYRELKRYGFTEGILLSITLSALRGSWINWTKFNSVIRKF